MISLRQAGSLRIVNLAATSAAIVRDAERTRDGDDDVTVTFWHRGMAEGFQGSQQNQIKACEIYVIDNAKPADPAGDWGAPRLASRSVWFLMLKCQIAAMEIAGRYSYADSEWVIKRVGRERRRGQRSGVPFASVSQLRRLGVLSWP
jgi:hypothetical protein